MEIVHSDEMASVSSLTNTANCFAIAAGAVVAGGLMTYGVYTMPYLAAFGFYVLTAVLYFRFFRSHEHARGAAREQSPEAETSA
jgi:predicted MFS family arabinose efflux permease